MNKKLIAGISALLAAGLAGGGFFWWSRTRQAPAPAAADQAVTDIQDTVDSINQRVAQDIYSGPDAATAAATVDIPDVNPYRNTNPFSDIKTNPFE